MPRISWREMVLWCSLVMKKLKTVAEVCQAPHFPNIRAIATAIAEQDPDQNVTALERRAKACVDPAIQ